MNHVALKQYQSVGVESGVSNASPHQLISMLLTGALDRIAAARGAIERGETARKGEMLSRAIAIIGGLRGSLNHEQGQDISENLGALYDYIEQLLVEANLASSSEKLVEAVSLLNEIKEGWDAIPVELRQGGYQ